MIALAVLITLVPPVVICLAFVALDYRERHAFRKRIDQRWRLQQKANAQFERLL